MARPVGYRVGTRVKVIKGPLTGREGVVLSRSGLFGERKYKVLFEGAVKPTSVRESLLTGA